ncbi:MAG TPA: hypothetical protein DEF12_11770 [Rhodobacteraceae bacterium]|nr:hypothetical protein [Paracoccaceae bacterium]HBV55693.1 hypothetical protein [Paracoccaceae bacterium]
MSSWVGMEGLSPAARAFDGNTPIPLSVTPERTANRADLIVRDSSGREVQRHALDPSASDVQWTGRDDFGLSAMPGLYTFSVESFLGETSLAETPVQSYSRLVEARLENGATVLVTEEGAEISADLISGIRKPAL